MINEFKRGLISNAFGKYSSLVLNFITNMILSRILTPEDYGVVSIVQIFQLFFSMLSNMGIAPAIVQVKELRREDTNVIFRFSLLIGLVLAILFALLGLPVSSFYTNTVFIPVFFLLAFSVFFSSISVVPNGILLRKKSFYELNASQVIASVIKTIFSIGLGLLGFKYYSILIGGVIQSIILFAALYFFTRPKLNVPLRKEPFDKIKRFAGNQFLFNTVNYFSRNLDSLLIGRYMTPSQLAYYNKSYTLALQPNALLTSVISSAFQPIMSKYEKDLPVIKNASYKMSKTLTIIGMPLSIFGIIASKEIIIFLFGEQWIGSIPSFAILFSSVWIQMIASSTGAVYQSANRTDLMLVSGVQSAIFNIIFIIIGVLIGSIESVAIAIVSSFTINLLINLYLLNVRTLKANYFEFFQIFKKPLIISIITLILLLPTIFISINSIILMLLIKGILFLIGFILGLILTGEFEYFKKIISA